MSDQQLEKEIELSNYQQHKANVIICEKQTKTQLAQYLHAICLSPTTKSLAQAMNNNHFLT